MISRLEGIFNPVSDSNGDLDLDCKITMSGDGDFHVGPRLIFNTVTELQPMPQPSGIIFSAVNFMYGEVRDGNTNRRGTESVQDRQSESRGRPPNFPIDNEGVRGRTR